MKTATRQCTILTAAILLTATGCSGPGEGHIKSVNAANDRWLAMRSTMHQHMAQQQFDTGDLDQAEKSIAEGLSMDMKNPKLHVLAARCAVERGQLERAYQRLDSAIALDEKLPEAYYFQGIVLQRWQRYEPALEKYRKAYELQADNPSFLLAIAETLVATDKTDEAITLLADKVAYFDQNAGVRAAVGQLYMMKKDYPKAATYLREAVVLRPNDRQLAQELATAQIASGQVEEGIKSLERLLSDSKDFSEHKDLRMSLAAAYLSAGRRGDARTVFLKITQAEPNDVDAWLRLAEVCWSQEDVNATLQASQRMIQLAPRRHEGYVLAGMAFEKRGRIEDALRMFDSAADAAPKSADPMLLRGMTLQRAGRTAAAAQAYAAALKRNPDDLRAKSLLASVSQKEAPLP